MGPKAGSIRWVVHSPISYEKAVFDGEGCFLPKNQEESLGETSPCHSDTRYLLQRAEKDKGFIAYPVLNPLFKAQIFPEENFVLLFKSDGALALKGKLYLDLCPLLQGNLHGEDIQRRLVRNGYEEVAVRAILYGLSSKGLIISSEHSLTPKQASFWCCLGLSPALAEQSLQQFPLSFKALPGAHLPENFQSKMQSWGGWKFASGEREPALTIYLANSFTQKEISLINRFHWKNGTKWCLLETNGTTSLFGPLFCPQQKNGPCWECLQFRLKNGAGNIHFLLSSGTSETRDEDWPLGAFHAELAEYLVDHLRAPISGHLISSSFPYGKLQYHWVGRRPQCSVCGETSLLNSSRPPQPIKLQSRSLNSISSGGVRNQSQEQVWQRYRKFIGPLTGVVSRLLTYKGEEGWFFVSQCDSNRAIKQRHLKNLKAGFRQRSSGKGRSAMESQIGSLCESLERYSGAFKGEEEIFHRAQYNDFKESEAIAPNEIMLFSKKQYQDRDEINKQGLNFYQVPYPFDPTVEVDWTPVWSLSEKRFKYMMTQQLYYDRFKESQYYASADSNGNAGGSCLEDAIIQGIYELIERDAFAIWWYNRLEFPGVDLTSFDVPYLHQAQKFYRQMDREIWVLDITHDFNVPCFVALSQKINSSPAPSLFGERVPI